VSVVANVAINVDSRGATQKLREVQSQANATEKAVGGLGGAVGKLAAAFSAIQAAKFVFLSAAEVESQTRSLQVLTGSAEKAGQIIKDLQQLGAVTPFTSSELIDAAKRLQAFGVETNKVVDTTRRLADVSGATGAELQGLVTAYGQVQAKGRLQGEELLQFQERGVALQQVLREEYKLSGEEFQSALEKGQISAQAVEFAIQKLTDAGGKYADGAVAQSDTLAGRLSTLQDGVQNLAARLGSVLAPALQSILGLAIDITNQVNSVFETILVQRQLAGNISNQQRDKLFRQAGQEAEQISKLRGGGKINADEFTKVREERFRDLLKTFGFERGIIKPPTPTPPSAAVTLPGLLSGSGGKGRTGKSEAEKAAEKAAREAEKLKQELQRSLEIGDQLGTQFSRDAALLFESSEIEKKRLQIQFDFQDRAKQIGELKNAEQKQNLTAISTEIQRLELIDLQTEALKRQADEAAQLFKDALAGTDFQVSTGGSIAEFVAESVIALEEFTSPLNRVKVAAEAIGTAFSNSFKGIITGTQSAQQAIAQFFDNIGQALIDYATTAIAQYIAIGIARLFAGLNPFAAASNNLSGTGALATSIPGLNVGGAIPFAEGGFVTGPTNAIIGEGGESEYVIPASKMNAAMARYSKGVRGEAVVGGEGGSAQAAAVSAGPMEPIDVRYSVERINNVDYVTTDQFQRGLAQAAQQGAVQGERRALRTLSNSPANRRRIGL
jgi:tape measure domain-containing protein